jgi:hypothetical protein
MRGFSPRNLKYMRPLAQAWPDSEFVQQPAAQLPWFHLCTFLDKVKDPEQRSWYASRTLEHRSATLSAGLHTGVVSHMTIMLDENAISVYLAGYINVDKLCYVKLQRIYG